MHSMARSCACTQTLYKSLMLISKMCITIMAMSLLVTLLSSCFLDDGQLDTMANIIWKLIKFTMYPCISFISFKVGTRVNQLEREAHAAVLQAATRRKLSQRSNKYNAAPVASKLAIDTNTESDTTHAAPVSPHKLRPRNRMRGRSSRLEFDSPKAPVPLTRRMSMSDPDSQEHYYSDSNVQW